ncbi:MAG: AzlD domain-containing protein [Pleurocapsa sp. SU_196_0]|nr:AzlD domain-containing protein [Pleurocapsa sp. SU_196_0]
MKGFELWLTLFGMALIAFGVRYGPMALLERFKLPVWLQQALRFVPAATLAGLVFPAFLTDHGRWVGLAYGPLWAGLIAAFVAWRFKNVLLTIGVGLVALTLIRWLFSV